MTRSVQLDPLGRRDVGDVVLDHQLVQPREELVPVGLRGQVRCRLPIIAAVPGDEEPIPPVKDFFRVIGRNEDRAAPIEPTGLLFVGRLGPDGRRPGRYCMRRLN
jgi:hypothetical protein